MISNAIVRFFENEFPVATDKLKYNSNPINANNIKKKVNFFIFPYLRNFDVFFLSSLEEV